MSEEQIIFYLSVIPMLILALFFLGLATYENYIKKDSRCKYCLSFSLTHFAGIGADGIKCDECGKTQ